MSSNTLALQGWTRRGGACRGPLKRRSAVSVLALIAGAVGLSGQATEALAQCAELAPGFYGCEGVVVVPQTINAPNAIVVTTAPFWVDTSNNGNGLALEVVGDGYIVYGSAHQAPLIGGGVRFESLGDFGQTLGGLYISSVGNISAEGSDGLEVINNGYGDVDVDWSGIIHNDGTNGAYIVNSYGSGTVNVNVGPVVADVMGLRVINTGSGATNVSVEGTASLIGFAGVGALVEGGQDAGDINVAVAGTRGASAGVLVRQYGVGSSFVAAAGPAVGDGATGIGIQVENSALAGNLTIESRYASGTAIGILAKNDGVGDTKVVSTELVTSTAGAGLQVTNGATAGALRLVLNEVDAGYNAVTAHNAGNGVTAVLATGSVTSLTANGVLASNTAQGTTLAVHVATVSGGLSGIVLENAGVGDTSLTATGTVTGSGAHAIDATHLGDGVMSIQTQGVVGAVDGLNVWKEGAGFASIVAHGDIQGGDNGIRFAGTDLSATSVRGFGSIVGQTGDGVLVQVGGSAGDIYVRLNEVTGQEHGVRIANFGEGSTQVIVDERATALGADSNGIDVNQASGVNLLIEATEVVGGHIGIFAFNNGSGGTQVTSTEKVTGGAYGVYVANGANAGDLTVGVHDLESGSTGVQVENQGDGGLVVTSTGTITAGGHGIHAFNGAQGGSITVEATTIQAGDSGVVAVNNGGDDMWIVTHGQVTAADGDGILAMNAVLATDLVLDVQAVQGSDEGIFAQNLGSGLTRIRSHDRVVGLAGNGVEVVGGTASGPLLVDVMDVTGVIVGVSAQNLGAGPTDLIVRGVVEGGDAGIEATAGGPNALTIQNIGLVRNTSGESFDRALTAEGETISLINAGGLLGTVSFTGDSGVLLNQGVWSTAGGESLFSGADQQVRNLGGGAIVAADDDAVGETTTWTGLTRFENAGVLTLQDGGVGDRLQTSAETDLLEGSVLAVDIGGAGGADRLVSLGGVWIATGSRLDVTLAGGLQLNERYVVVDAPSVTGNFDFDEEFLTAFAGLRDGYTATTAYVEFAQLRALAEAASTPNQGAAAAGADSLPDGEPLKDALLMLPDDATARDAFDQLSGEIHPASRTAVVEDARLPRQAVLDRLALDQPERSVWGRAIGAGGHNDGDANADRLDRDTYGLIFGVDAPMGAVTAGLAVGWLESDMDLGHRNSEGTVQALHLVGYVGGEVGGWSLRGGAGYGVTSAKTHRRVSFPGISQRLSADYDGGVLQGFAEAGRAFTVERGKVEPFLNLALLRVDTDGFTETGGSAALSADKAEQTSGYATLGLRFAMPATDTVDLRGQVGWRHGWGDLEPEGRHAFDGGDAFTVVGAAASEDAAIVALEARWQVSQGLSVGVAYDGVMGADAQDHAATAGFKLRF